MNFDNSKKYIDDKIKIFKIPYFSCIVKKDGKTIFNYYSSSKNNLLVMYSLSKPVTTVAFLQLVEKGLISLEDDVDKYIPEYTNLFNLRTGESIKNKIKIKHLLNMTSGLDYNVKRNAIIDLVKNNNEVGTIEICSKFAKDGLVFEPGSEFLYSLSLDVIAALIEKITTTKFSTYVKTNVFDILNMNHSSFRHDKELVNKCIDEYALDSNSKLMKVERYYESFFPSNNYESGGAGLISTIEDYSIFADSLASGSNLIIKDKTLDLMTSIYVNDFDFYNLNKDYGYGLGVRVRKNETEEGIPAGEFGWDGAAGSYVLIDRKNKISIVMGLTIQNWPYSLKELHLQIVKQIYKDIKNLS